MNHDFSDYYESNLKLLEKYHPETWKRVLHEQPEPVGTIFKSQNGKPNLTAENEGSRLITFHDEKTPDKDKNIFLSKIPEDFKGFVAILGMGLGYAVTEILKSRSFIQSLAVFELDPGIFIQAMKYKNLTGFLDDPRLILCVGPVDNINASLKKASRTIQLEDAAIYHHLPSFNYSLEAYTALKGTIFEHVNSMNVGGTTTRALGKKFLNNRFEHICTIHHHRLLEQIQNRFFGEPAILVAGGPSLDKNVHLLEQVQEKAVIFAVDTVLPTLLKNGVHPHFLSSIDPQNLTYEKFADCVPAAKDIALICSSWVNLRTPKVFPASQVFWTFTAKPIEAWINSLLGGQILNGGASTVAHLNLIAAHLLGCDPIVFIGQDLAFPKTATHAEGTVLHGAAPTGIIKGHRIEETVKGVDGSMLRTDRAFLSMKQHFETFIAKAEQNHINATEGGAHIEGTTVLSLQDVIDTYCQKEIATTRRIREYALSTGVLDPEKMLSAFSSMQDKIQKIKKEIKKSDSLTNTLRKELRPANQNRAVKSFAMLSPKQQKKIHTIDRIHQNIDKEINVWKIAEEITMEGLKESERMRQEISLLQNKPGKYLEWLFKNFDRLNGINQIRIETLQLLETNFSKVLSFSEKEQEFTRQIQNEKNVHKNMLELIRLHMDSHNCFIALPLVEKLLTDQPDSAELNFYAGCIAAESNRHEQANEFFRKAVNLSPDAEKKVRSFRENLGDEFMEFVLYFKTQPGRSASVKYMLFKGLTYCPDHKGLLRELNAVLKEDLKSVSDLFEQNNPTGAEPVITEWVERLSKDLSLAERIPPVYAGQVFLNAGRLLTAKKNYPQALPCFQTAMRFIPDNHDLHFITIDTLFLSQDFNGAIAAIKNAIEVDKKFAAYWETIGDSLQEAGQNEDAVFAYEQCFIHLPENIHLLQKIGDCYLAMGQLEAAKASFEQLKLKMGQQKGS